MIHLRNPDDATIARMVSEILDGVRNRAALARDLGVNRATIYNWLRGKEPSIPELAKIATVTETSIRIDLGPLNNVNGDRDSTQDTRLAVIEQQLQSLMQVTLTNQAAIMRMLGGGSPLPPEG